MPPVAGLVVSDWQVLADQRIPGVYWLIWLGCQYDANQPGDCSATAWQQYQKAVL
jgi:hypothetical protein